MINIRSKGQNGEREIVDAIEDVHKKVLASFGIPYPNKPICQRNQQQASVGGCDLIGTFGLAIEVKRQETLSINKWWEQTERQANAKQETPVLLYRQNRKSWKCVIEVFLQEDVFSSKTVRAEISFDDFLAFYERSVISIIKKTGFKVT
jgi:Holliday junction resolvase